MSKISKNIQMLNVLSSGRKYSCKQLAEILEISPRMVRTYKEELEKEGIYIDSILGKDGGYILRSKIEMPLILFNNNDIDIIDSLIKKSNNVEDSNKLKEIKNKIRTYCKMLNNDYQFLTPSKKEILEDIKEAITKNKSVQIEYHNKNEKKQRIIYPKQIYVYENLIMIVVQYSENLDDIRHLNLNRIDKICK